MAQRDQIPRASRNRGLRCQWIRRVKEARPGLCPGPAKGRKAPGPRTLSNGFQGATAPWRVQGRALAFLPYLHRNRVVGSQHNARLPSPQQGDDVRLNAEQLRALQAPLKQQYRESPQAAIAPARAEARLDPDSIACAVPSWHGETVAGLHPATGGNGELACSADMLLEAVVACAGVTLRAVATAMGIAIRHGRVVAEGSWDARGTLGIDRAAPVGLTDITLRFDIEFGRRSGEARAADRNHRTLLRHSSDFAEPAADSAAGAGRPGVCSSLIARRDQAARPA